MDIITAAILIYAPLTLVGMGLAWISGWPQARAVHQGATTHGLARAAALALWAIAMILVPLIGHGDWVHLYWSVQIPLTGLFLMGGAWLDSSAAGLAEQAPTGWKRLCAWLATLRSAPAIWLLMTASLAVTPWLLLSFDGSAAESPRPFGSVTGELIGLARWGFGGAIPSSLEPIHQHEFERGLGYLPRAITVPLGSLFIAAWTSLFFVGLALLGRIVPKWRCSLRASPALVVIALTILGVFVPLPWGLEIDEFFPTSRSSGIWRAAPTSLRSFGPLAVTTLACLVIWAVTAILATSRSRRRVGASGPQTS